MKVNQWFTVTLIDLFNFCMFLPTSHWGQFTFLGKQNLGMIRKKLFYTQYWANENK